MPDEDELRALYEAFSRGDMDAVLGFCTDDIVFHVPGRNQGAGAYQGRDGFMNLVGKVMQISGGSFKEELLDALANDRHGVALARHSLERDGKTHEYHTVHVWRVFGDKYSEWWEHPGDPIAFDEAGTQAARARSSRSKRPLCPARIIDVLDGAYGTPPWRPHGDPLAELVLTLLSQNTSDSNSGRAFIRLLASFPDWQSVLGADVKAVERAIQPGGLAPTKAPRLQAMLREIWSRCGSFELSFLKKMPLEEARAWLRSLPGVGPKTAACVLLFSLGRPALPVDTHVHRVATRLGLVPERTSAERAHELLEAMLTPEQMYPFHIQLIKHGRRTCTAQRPKCPACPLRKGCPSATVIFHPELGSRRGVRRGRAPLPGGLGGVRPK